MTAHYRSITKKIKTSHLVWFEQTNQWVNFEKPAYFVYKLFRKGQSSNLISHKASKKYGLTEEIALTFVNDIVQKIQKLLEFNVLPVDPFGELLLPPHSSIKFPFCHTYIINGKFIKVWLETALLGYYIHPVFQQLEVQTDLKNLLVEFEIFSFEQKTILRIKNNPEKFWSFDESPALKRRLFIEISNAIYSKDEKDWMSFLHASAVTNGKETILFSSASGSGKSTLSALLFETGLQMVSDDFVPIDSLNKRAFPFPAAISVKEKAFALFPAEKLMDLKYQNLKNKSVKFLNPSVTGRDWYKAKRVKKIVFVSYNPDVSFKISQLALPDALRMFYEQASMTGSYENTKKFIDWFVKVNCYELVYSDNRKAIKKIKDLFEDQ
jgi:hypothetical protein